jgi:hypothetical protein
MENFCIYVIYYPSSGFDGDPIKYLSGNIYSFVYIDYGKSSNELDNELQSQGFKGYKIILSRDVTERELTPNGWIPSPPSKDDGDPTQYKDWIKTPFAKWLVFQRNDDLGSEHGVERFSLLYMCADGVAAFQALYLSNECSPLMVAIIQPGHGFGANWTNYTNSQEIFARTVLENPAGTPKILLYGGIGKRDFYRSPCWSQFSQHICFLEKANSGSIGVWQYSI